MTQTSPQKNDKEQDSKPSELVVGSVTFVIFIIFMIVWMYFVPGS